ncbi:MAG: hypothetical protein M1837_002159 [Sclerophora amabilis]|nr:MAG: hypothetical protein M1837_002159 [Sclerophora amabilis]
MLLRVFGDDTPIVFLHPQKARVPEAPATPPSDSMSDLVSDGVDNAVSEAQEIQPEDEKANGVEEADSSSSDLIAVALVSRQFHSLACAQLYRTFSIVFPDDDDPAFDSPIDGLAGGLDTMVTSEHNHAKHLKEIVLDSLSGGQEGERAYRHYSLDVSCGKFLNTLLVLCLRKAKALESFHWNIRVELSRPVLKALQEIPNLRNLHVRLQSGPSLYQPPPPLPSMETAASMSTSPPIPSTSAPASSSLFYSAKTVPTPKAPLPSRAASSVEPPSFAGFRSLSSLAVLDMDTLDYLKELASCIEASSSSLKKLKLSISERMARTARRPVVEDSDDSDQEVDEFGNPIIQPLPTLPISGPPEGVQEKEAKVRVARLSQDQILGKLFQVDKPLPEEKKDQNKSREGESGRRKFSKDEAVAARKFIDILKKTTKTLLEATSDVNPNQPKFKQDALEALQMIGKSAKQLLNATLESEKNQLEKVVQLQNGSKDKVAEKAPKTSVPEEVSPVDTEANREARSKDKAVEESDSNATIDDPELSVSGSKGAEPEEMVDAPSLFANDTTTNAKKPSPNQSKDTQPEEIDIDHPDEVADDIDEEEIVAHFTKAVEQIQATRPQTEDVSIKPEDDNEASDLTMSGGLNHLDEVAARAKPVACESRHLSEAQTGNGTFTQQRSERTSSAEGRDSSEQAIKDYVRSTRKITLRSLSLYLIPIRCSVLFHAIDLANLSRITLLNVGPQAPFWTVMSTLHKSNPLKLQSIFTDNVNPAFLALVNSLDSLKELFMLERSNRSRVEPLAARTTVTITEIRNQVLKKHLKSLKRLMIRNECDYGWDLDSKTIRLLTKQGDGLSELAVSIGLANFHLLLQYLPGLSSLKALHIIHFRIEDTCRTVKRDLLRFTIDIVAHHPQMKLEHIGLDDDVHRLLRKSASDRKKPNKTKNKKKKVNADSAVQTSSSAAAAEAAAAATDGAAEDSSSSNESTEPDSDADTVVHGTNRPRLKISTLENVKFYDVYGVRIFRKDIRAGSL